MFFQSIGSMMAAGTDLSIHIRRVGEQLVVSTLPRNNNLKDEAQSYLMPLTVTGTPMELDAGYLQAILQPIQRAGGLLVNLEQFEKQAAATASKAKAEKPKVDNEANDAKEKRENYDKCLKKADELVAGKRYSEALTYLKQAKTFATPMQQTDLAKKTKMLEQEVAQGTLFGMEEAAETKPVPQQPPVQQQIMQPVQQPQQPGYYQPTVQQPMQQPQSQPMQQPVIHPAQFAVSGNGQPLPQRPQQRPAPIMQQQQPLTQPAYNPSPWDEREDDADNTDFRQDPYAGYPDFPQEYRMRDEAQLAAVY